MSEANTHTHTHNITPAPAEKEEKEASAHAPSPKQQARSYRSATSLAPSPSQTKQKHRLRCVLCCMLHAASQTEQAVAGDPACLDNTACDINARNYMFVYTSWGSTMIGTFLRKSLSHIPSMNQRFSGSIFSWGNIS